LKDSDAEWLDALPEKALKFLTLSAGIAEDADADAALEPEVPAAEAAPRAAAAPEKPVVVAPVPAPVAAPAPAPLTGEEWMAAAPPEIRALVDRAKTDEATRKTALLAALKGKTTGAYTDAELAALPVEQLTRIAKLAIKETPRTAIDYSGAIVAPAPDPTVIPPAPDLHARVRAAAIAKGVKGVVQPPTLQ
jgi:hypothetical protein